MHIFIETSEIHYNILIPREENSKDVCDANRGKTVTSEILKRKKVLIGDFKDSLCVTETV